MQARLRKFALEAGRRELSPAAHRAVIALRKAGHEVKRLPDHRHRHLLDGEIVPTSWLVDMAHAGGRPRAETPFNP